jgi:hypothetical protein
MKNTVFILIIIILSAAAFYLVNKPAKSTADIDHEMLRVERSGISEVILSSDIFSVRLVREEDIWKVQIGEELSDAEPEKIGSLLDFSKR